MNKKNDSSKWFSYFTLFLIIFSAVTIHVLLFLADDRPFLDHDTIYTPYFAPFLLIIKLLLPLKNIDMVNKNVFIYKMINIIYFIPLILMTYLLGKKSRSKNVGIVAAFLISTTPFILNTYRKSDAVILLTTFVAVAFYYFLKAIEFRGRRYVLCLALSLLVLKFIHYSSSLYILPFLSLVIVMMIRDGKYKGKAFTFILFFLVFCLGFIFIERLGGLLKFGQTPVPYAWACGHYQITWNKILFALSPEVFFSQLWQLVVELKELSPYFPFYFYVCTGSFLYYSFKLGYLKWKKRTIEGFEIYYLLFVYGVILLFNFLYLVISQTGNQLIAITFLAPCFISMALLNSLLLDDFYQKFKERPVIRFVAFFLMGVFILHQAHMSFPIDLPVNQKKRHEQIYFYYPVKDDFGLTQHIDYFRKNYCPEKGGKKIAISTFDNAGPTPNLRSFSYLLSLNLEMDYFVPLDYAAHRNLIFYYATGFRQFKEREIIFYLYDVFNQEKEIDISAIKINLMTELENRFGKTVAEKCKFKVALPYGLRMAVMDEGEVIDVIRQYLCFIFEYNNE